MIKKEVEQWVGVVQQRKVEALPRNSFGYFPGKGQTNAPSCMHV